MNIKLNLIPFEKRREIEKHEQFSLVIRTEIWLTAIILCFLAVLFCFKFILNMNYQSNLTAQEKTNKEEQYVKIRNFDEKFSAINSQITGILAVEKGQLYWSNLFSKLSRAVFPGIKIKTVETSDYYITLNGLADNRGDLILYKEKLENLECLANINLPLSELVEKDNVEFQIDFQVKPECLRKE